MESASGLIYAYDIDGNGTAESLGWDGVREWKPGQGFLWVHLDYTVEDAKQWLREDSGIDWITRQALLAEDPRPRMQAAGNALQVIIRGINLNAGARHEDMVSLRIWIDGDRVITMRHRRFDAIKALNAAVLDNRAPGSTGGMLASIVERILHRISGVVDTIDDEVDELEALVLSAEELTLRTKLSRFRRQAIALRRFIAPQRDVLARLQTERVPWLADADRIRLRDSGDRLLRTIEELDAAKDRAVVTQEELTSKMSDMMNKRLYTLSIVAAIFLPLGFATGALGVNLGGMPGTTWEWGFAVMCVVMVGLGAFQLWLFRKLGWF